MTRFLNQFLQKMINREKEAWDRRQNRESLESKQILEMPLNQLSVCAIDSETTGFQPQSGDEILSIAAVHWQRGISSNPFCSFVQIVSHIPPHITELTGITEKDIANAPPVQEVLPAFLNHIGSSVLIGYYIGHDVRFINYYLWKKFRTRLQHRVLELGKVVGLLYPDMANASFDEVCSALGISISERHTAIGDAYAVAALWGKLAIALQDNGIDHLLGLYEQLVKQRQCTSSFED